MIVWIAVLFALLSCSTPEVKELASEAPATAQAETPPAPAPAFDVALYRPHAEAFDKFLKKELNPTEIFMLVEACNRDKNSNPFCYGILNAGAWDAKLSERRSRRPARVRRMRLVRPKFKRGQLQNWLELRYAAVPALIRGLTATPPRERRIVEARAHTERLCPNNIAIAIAAHLEDALPDRAEPLDISKLYVRGGDCLTAKPIDREILLTRAALFLYSKGKYAEAAALFQKSSDLEGPYVGRSLYWLHRTHTALGKTELSEKVLTKLKERYPFSFHTLVALMRLNRDPGEILVKSPIPTQKRSEDMPEVNRLLEEIELLTRLGFTDAAARLFEWTLTESESLEPEVRMYLAELKQEQGDHHSHISILSDVLYNHPELISRETMELYFPKVYFPIFEKKAGSIDPFFLLAIARQESAFNVRAISSANARGLLQLLPSTSRKYDHGGKLDLMKPEDNIEVGSRFFMELLTRFNGNVHFALAAYNAGMQRLDTWMNRYPASEPMLFIDLIPYRETREYVASILRNYYWYRRLHQESKIPRNLFITPTQVVQ